MNYNVKKSLPEECSDLPADCRTIQRRGQRKGGTRRGETETSCSPLHNSEMKLYEFIIIFKVFAQGEHNVDHQ